MKQKIYDCQDGCAVESTLQIISGRWKSVILYHLIFKGEYRYSELQKFIPSITRRMLSLQLKDLESDRLIYRKVLQEKPLMVAYGATEKGMSLKPVIQMLNQWGHEYNQANNSPDEELVQV